MDISILIIVSFILVLCIYVYQEYYRSRSHVMEEFKDRRNADNSFLNYFNEKERNWKELKKHIDEIGLDVIKLKKRVIDGDIAELPPNEDNEQLKETVRVLSEQLASIQGSIASLSDSVDEVRTGLSKVTVIRQELEGIRKEIDQKYQNKDYVSTTDLQNLRDELKTQFDTRKDLVDASLNKVDRYREDVVESNKTRFKEYDERFERYMADIDNRINSMNQNYTGMIKQSVSGMAEEIDDLKAQVNTNETGINDLKDHYHEQYALVDEVDDTIEETVEKYLKNRTFNSTESTHEEMRKQIQKIIAEQENERGHNSNDQRFITRSEFDRFYTDQTDRDATQDSKLRNLNVDYEMKDVVTRGELDERLNMYVSKMSFAPFIEDITSFRRGALSKKEADTEAENEVRSNIPNTFAPAVKFMNNIID